MVGKTFLVTGGAGFIGSHLVKKLLSLNHKVICMDNEFRGTFKNIDRNNKKLQIKKGDVRNQSDWPKTKVDGVFHLAAINGTINFYKIPDIVLDVNVKGTINAVEYVKKNKIPYLCFASSSETYGIPKKFPTPESEMLTVPNLDNPRWSYGASKTIGEVYCINYAKKFNFKCSIIRYNNVYGPRDEKGHVIPDLISKILKNKKFSVEGTGNETRSFCFINDAIDATLLIYKKQKTKFEIFNVGVDTETKISHLIKYLEKISQKKISPSFKIKKNAGTKRRQPNILKLKKIGFKPKINFNEGLKITFNWYSKIFSNK